MKNKPILYQTNEGEIKINIDYGKDTIWASLD